MPKASEVGTLGRAALWSGLALACGLALYAAWPLVGGQLPQEDAYGLGRLTAGGGGALFAPGTRVLLGLEGLAAAPGVAARTWFGLGLWFAVIVAGGACTARGLDAGGGAGVTGGVSGAVAGGVAVALVLASFPWPSQLVAQATGQGALAAAACLIGVLACLARPSRVRTPLALLGAALLLTLVPWYSALFVCVLALFWNERPRLAGGLLAVVVAARLFGLSELPHAVVPAWCGQRAERPAALLRTLGAPLELGVLGALLAIADRRARRWWWGAALLGLALAFDAWRFEAAYLARGSGRAGLLLVEGSLAVALAAGMAARPGAPEATGAPGATTTRSPSHWRGLVGLAALAVVLGSRVPSARAEARDARARVAAEEAHRIRLREALAGTDASDEPVLYALFPPPAEGRVPAPWGLLGPGLAGSGGTGVVRPVWPLVPLSGCDDDARPYLMQPRANLVWPFGGSKRNVPRLPLERSGDTLVLRGDYPHARMEFVLYTEHGYAATQLGAFRDWPAERPAGAGMTARRVPLAAVVAGWDTAIRMARSFGATRAYLEVRAVDDARGKRNRPVAASSFEELDLAELARLLPATRASAGR